MKDPKLDWPLTIEINVAWGDMDAFAHVNNTVYLRWFESARIVYFERTGILDNMKSSGVGPILARSSIDYRKPVVYPDRVFVSVRLREIGNTSFTLEYRVTSQAQSNVVVAEGESVVVMVNYNSGSKVPLSQSQKEKLRFHSSDEGH